MDRFALDFTFKEDREAPTRFVNRVEKFGDTGRIDANVNSLQIQRKIVGDLSGSFHPLPRRQAESPHSAEVKVAVEDH